MKSFGKQSNCPTSHKILAYVQGSLRPLARERIAQHCALCDFCGAEAQLLTKFRPAEEIHKPGPTPTRITVLGVRLPLAGTTMVARRRAA